MKKPTPEVAYMLALVAAQKWQVKMAKDRLAQNVARLTEAMDHEVRHLEGLQRGLREVQKDSGKAKYAAAMPWLVD